jgi:predicted HTH transcriptional regulator
LIVCNSRFGDDSSLRELHGPKADGTLLRDALIDHDTGMFDRNEVEFAPEAKSQRVCDAIEEFFQKAESDDTLLFYYSGHGLIRNQQLFLCTEDTAERRLVSTAISESTIKSIIANSFARVKIIILDCCYGGMLKGDDITESLSGSGRYVIAATSATERATDATFRGLPSPFTRILAEALTAKAADRDGDGFVDLDDIYSYLERTPFEGPRPQRKFDGQGAVSIARRTRPSKSSPQRGNATGVSPQHSESPLHESPLPVLSYMDTLAPRVTFSREHVSQFRANIRGDVADSIPPQLSNEAFLEHIGVMREDSLTYAGVLLFGRNPSALFPTAVIQCARFHGTTKTVRLEPAEFNGTVANVIVQARDFVARHARMGETPTSQSAFAETTYRYPMVAVREIIANAIVHRDYEDQVSCVQIHMFDDRLEIINPGQLNGTPTLPEGEIPLSQLERRSQRRNFRLARTLGLSRLVEGVGAGVPRAIADSHAAGAREPVVVMDAKSVTVKIFPGAVEEMPDLRSREEVPRYETASGGRRQPMYQLIAEDLRAQITSGDLGPGAKLPTEAELGEKYEASRNTIRDAIKRLIAEGGLEARPGQGTFVTWKVDPFVTVLTTDPTTGFGGGDTARYLSEVHKVHREPMNSVPRVEVTVASDAVASLLGLPRETRVVSRSQERYIDGIPWSKQTSFYLMDFITKGADRLLTAADIAEGTVRYLADKIGVKQSGYRDLITARPTTDDEQAFFGIGYDATVMVVSRVAFDQKNTPMRLTVTIFPADRNQLIVNVGPGVPDFTNDNRGG